MFALVKIGRGPISRAIAGSLRAPAPLSAQSPNLIAVGGHRSAPSA
jgi:hypothetical protein